MKLKKKKKNPRDGSWKRKNKVEALEVLCITKIVSSFFFIIIIIILCIIWDPPIEMPQERETNWGIIQFFLLNIYMCARARAFIFWS